MEHWESGDRKYMDVYVNFGLFIMITMNNVKLPIERIYFVIIGLKEGGLPSC